jgi:hypothetical protein
MDAQKLVTGTIKALRKKPITTITVLQSLFTVGLVFDFINWTPEQIGAVTGLITGLLGISSTQVTSNVALQELADAGGELPPEE